jgi:AmmeMemoRadiSam system protein A
VQTNEGTPIGIDNRAPIATIVGSSGRFPSTPALDLSVLFAMPASYPADIQAVLLDVAAASLAHGVRTGAALEVAADEYPEPARRAGASFVTLRIGAELRGCIGSLRAQVPLVADVAQNAFSAGFRDPRFSPVAHDELGSLSISISVLSQPEPVSVDSETQLLDLMRERDHGWILQLGNRRGLLLPAVWDSIADPVEFLGQLKAKARFRPDFWSDEIVVERFTAASFGQRDEG